MTAPRVVLVDDEPSLIKLVSFNLKARGYEVIVATNGLEAIERVKDCNPDLVILDVTMPGMDGFEACGYIREVSETAIIMLTARGAEGDKIHALDLGADDYLTKPFAVGELMARIRAVLRRFSRAQTLKDRTDCLQVGDLVIDFEHRRVMLAGELIKLTPIEYALLEHLAMHPDHVLTHRDLLTSIWGPEYRNQTEYLRVYMGRLRRKLERDPMNPEYLRTEPHVGYRFDPGPR